MAYAKVKRKELKCKYCEKKYKGRKGQLYCSMNCGTQWFRYEKPKSETHQKECLWCNISFMALRINDKYCCDNHAKQYRKYKHDEKRNTLKKLTKDKRKKCGWCKESFNVRRLSQRCCSRICYEKYYEKHLRNGEKARKRARVHYWKHRNKNLAKQYNITPEQYKDITKKCYFCNFKEVVDCHHIIPRAKGGQDSLENYIGVCPNHHKLIHLRGYKITGGYKKWNLEKGKQRRD